MTERIRQLGREGGSGENRNEIGRGGQQQGRFRRRNKSRDIDKKTCANRRVRERNIWEDGKMGR